MPSTTYNIDQILKRIPNSSREEIRDVINEMQTIVYSQDCEQTMKIEKTGMPPFLTTIDGQYEYDCPSDCRRTAAIITLGLRPAYSRLKAIGPIKEYYFQGKEFNLVQAETRDANISNLAKIYFKDNPGSTTDKFYHVYYIKPSQILDEESDQITLPEETHYLLRKAVVALMTTEEYGESSYDDSVIERFARKIRNKLNGGYHGITGFTPVRDIDREFSYDFGYEGQP